MTKDNGRDLKTVDVLAVLDDAMSEQRYMAQMGRPNIEIKADPAQPANLKAARAAIAELIEDAEIGLETLESEGLGDGYTGGILRASIARVKGGEASKKEERRTGPQVIVGDQVVNGNMTFNVGGRDKSKT